MKSVYLSEPSVLCGAGASCNELWESVISGDQKGIKTVSALNDNKFFVGRVDDSVLKETSSKYKMRIMSLEETALLGLEAQINLAKQKYSADRIGVCVGSCDNGTELSLKGHRAYFSEGKFPEDYSLEIQGADYVSTFISEKYGLTGPTLTFSTACSSSAGAIIKAAELIKAGICDAVIAGGIDIASNTVLMGFDSLEAVSSEVTNPFSANRHGITLGEAAAFFVVTADKLDEDSLSVELLGYGESADAYHMTSPDPSGEGAACAMEQALNRAKLKPSDIDYVNLHGTGTKFNDSMEAKAVDKIFGDYKVPVSTTKPMTGHTLGAAGALEAAICYCTILKNDCANEIKLPIQVWDGVQDAELPVLNIVGKDNKWENTGKVKICMSNSFAFGGANSCLILGVK